MFCNFCSSDPEILKSNVGVLVDVGLVEEKVIGSSEEVFNYLLATHTCTTLSKLSQRNAKAGIYSKQFRFPNDNKIFTSLSALLTEGMFELKKTGWLPHLSASYRCERSGVRFPGRSNRHSVVTVVTFLHSCVVQTLSLWRWAPPLVTRFGVIPRV